MYIYDNNEFEVTMPQGQFNLAQDEDKLADYKNRKQAFEELPSAAKKSIVKKTEDHMEKYGDDSRKKTTKEILAVVWWRGRGAYFGNPESVRPVVTSAEQWAMARVNGFLYALRTLKFKRKPFDTDLLPKDHPHSSKKRTIASFKEYPKAEDEEIWGWEAGAQEEVLGDPPNWSRYKKAHLWYDDENLESLSGYRLPIAKMIDGELKLVFRGIASAMGAVKLLLQRRYDEIKIPVDGIPVADYEKLFDELVKYYKLFGKEPPVKPEEEMEDRESLNEGNTGEVFIEKFLDEEDLQDDDIFLDLSAVRAVGDIDPTNFPKRGDDKKVSLRNSQWPIFPIDFAEKIKNEYPEIWDKGGNIRGNSQYRKLVPIHQRGGYPETDGEEHAIRLREAWVARHLEDFRIAGVIAQIKWLAIGSRGLQYMKDLVREEMKKIDDKKQKAENRADLVEEGNLEVRSLEVLSDGSREYSVDVRSKTWLSVENLEIRRSEDQKDDRYYEISGVASSTSVDHYGTEMSHECLRSMATQIRNGVPILPRHESTKSSGIAEWDEVIGRTYSAKIQRSATQSPSVPMEKQYILNVQSRLYIEDSRAKELVRRLNRGEPIGQSIGGWFERVRVQESESGEIQRIIVDDVILDHIAITRAPANPDSHSLDTLSIRSAIQQYRGKLMADNNSKIEESGSDKELETRHVSHVEETDDKIIVHYEKSHMHKEEASEEMTEEVVEESVTRAKEEERMAHGDEEKRMEEYMKEYAAMQEAMERMKEEMERMKEEMEKMKEYSNYEEKAAHEDKEERAAHDEEDEERGSYKIRAVVPFQDLPMAPPDTTWDWNTDAQDAILGDDEDRDWDMYMKAHLYYNPENLEVKASYKLPIAMMIDGELHAVLHGIQAAMAALNGARGGVDIPTEDKKAIYEHISAYYDKFGKEVPPLKLSQNVDEQFDNSNKIDNSITTTMGEEMTEDQIRQITESVTKAVLENVNSRSATEPSVKPEDSEIEQLRSRLEKTEAMLQRAVETPQRTGRHSTAFIRAGIGATNEFTRAINAAKSEGLSVFPSFVERSADKLAEENGHAEMTTSQIGQMLTRGLRAAEMDGLITGLKSDW